MIIGIAAVAENLAVGRNGKLPWHYSDDLKFFRETTLNHAVVMGFNTWQSIGKPLPKRLNIVLSRSHDAASGANVLTARNAAQITALAKYLNCDLYIIGGAKTYAEFAGVIEKWIITKIPESVDDADTFMPNDFLKNFDLSDQLSLAENLTVEIFSKK